jgi:hypothetical protein
MPYQIDLSESPFAYHRVDHPILVVHVFRPFLIVVLSAALLIFILQKLLQTNALVVESIVYLLIN